MNVKLDAFVVQSDNMNVSFNLGVLLVGALIKAEDLSKSYGAFKALKSVSFEINKGQIIGLIGPNGAGKTTLLKSLIGLTAYKGHLDVLGFNPAYKRHSLMNHLCFIADVAILPRWLTATHAIELMSGVHPRFNEEKAKHFLSKTEINLNAKVNTLSKGMIVQLHLALIMAIDVELLILDEPTLGLDIIYRKQFYQSLLNDYFSENKTIIIATHQIEEVESLLSRIMMLNHGSLLLDCQMNELKKRFFAVKSNQYHDELIGLNPIFSQKGLNETHYLYEGVPDLKFDQLGEVYSPSVSDIFQAKILGEGQGK